MWLFLHGQTQTDEYVNTLTLEYLQFLLMTTGNFSLTKADRLIHNIIFDSLVMQKLIV